MSVDKVLFIRHGQTAFNQERRLQGAMPVPLNSQGRRQARSLARYLKTVPIDAIYTNPRPRALETARIIGEALGQSPYEDERLAEIAFGDFEGHTFAEVQARYPEAYRKWEAGYRAYRVPGGESRVDVQRRMAAAWSDIVNSARPGNGCHSRAQLRHDDSALFNVCPATRQGDDELLNHDALPLPGYMGD